MIRFALWVNYGTKNQKKVLKAKASDLVDDGDFDDDEDETDGRNVDVHDGYDDNIQFSSTENNMNYESDYRPSASVAQLVKKRVFTTSWRSRAIGKIWKPRFKITPQF